MNENLAPYVGPRPFDSASQHLFYGRNFEADEVFNLISAHQLLLLYSPSGAGKTSLINAAVIPLLEREGYDVLPPARVSTTLPDGLLDGDVKNVYLFNCLTSWAKADRANLPAVARMSLRDFLDRHTSSNVDQQDRLLILIFEQFEELFTSYPERWRDRREFFEEIRLALRDMPLLRILFVMREEFIAQIDPFAPLLPERLRTRFRLEPLRQGPALDAATEPLRQVKRAFADGVAEKLVDSLMRISVVTGRQTIEVPGEFVEPVQLQVVCQSIWDSLPPDVEVIQEQFVQTYGDTDKALSNYYEVCVSKAAANSDIQIGRLRQWFENVLITPSGTRAQVFLEASGSHGIPSSVIEMLEDSHLIRTEFARGARWIELTNDRFIKPILKSNRRWLDSFGVISVQLDRLEMRASEWMNHDRGLLEESELFTAKGWLERADSEGLAVSDGLFSFVKASEAAIEEGSRQRAFAEQTIHTALERQRARVVRLLRLNAILAIALLIVAMVVIIRWLL